MEEKKNKNFDYLCPKFIHETCPKKTIHKLLTAGYLLNGPIYVFFFEETNGPKFGSPLTRKSWAHRLRAIWMGEIFFILGRIIWIRAKRYKGVSEWF